MESLVPAGIEKIDRSQCLTYLDTTPTATDETWNILGVGITNFAINYNPQVEQEKWIIEDTARNDHTSNQKQAPADQKMYKGDPCFEFALGARDKLNYRTHILDIDRWNGNNGTYPARYTDGKLVISSELGENAVLSYTLYYDGDPIQGVVTYTDGKPVFTPSVSI